MCRFAIRNGLELPDNGNTVKLWSPTEGYHSVLSLDTAAVDITRGQLFGAFLE